MREDQLHNFQLWFEQYVKLFYSDDPVHQAGIKFKEEHTKRVCEKIIRIGRSLHMSHRDLYMAEAIALFHDIGRFRQFQVYKTFNDRTSENHATLGLSELEKAGVLCVLEKEEQNVIKKAVEYHNRYNLPRTETERVLTFSRLIRDADKLDIMETFTTYVLKQHPEPNPVLEAVICASKTERYTPALINYLLQRKGFSYDEVCNSNDRKLLYLSWIYDINFTYTLSEISRNGYVKVFIESLPDTTEIRKVHDYLQLYMDKRRESEGAFNYDSTRG